MRGTPRKQGSFPRGREAWPALKGKTSKEVGFPSSLSGRTFSSFFTFFFGEFPSPLYSHTSFLSPGTLRALSPEREKNEVWASTSGNMGFSLEEGETSPSSHGSPLKRQEILPPPSLVGPPSSLYVLFRGVSSSLSSQTSSSFPGTLAGLSSERGKNEV